MQVTGATFKPDTQTPTARVMVGLPVTVMVVVEIEAASVPALVCAPFISQLLKLVRAVWLMLDVIVCAATVVKLFVEAVEGSVVAA